MRPAIDACIFDLDGTLLDTLDDLANAMNMVLRARGLAEHLADAYRFFVGEGMETMVRRAAPEGTGDAVLASMVPDFRDAYAKSWADKTRPYPGIEAMLDALSGRHVPFAVLSNKPHEFTRLMIRHFFPGAAFTAVLGSPRGGKAKPAPAMALGLARDFGVRPDRVLFLGDSSIDMDTARNAGMVPAGALWGFRPASELSGHGAAILLQSPGELLSHL